MNNESLPISSFEGKTLCNEHQNKLLQLPLSVILSFLGIVEKFGKIDPTPKGKRTLQLQQVPKHENQKAHKY
jgi:hypothetical protein